MGKVRSVEYDGGIKTKYIQESDGKLTINNQQNVNPLYNTTDHPEHKSLRGGVTDVRSDFPVSRSVVGIFRILGRVTD